MEPFNIAVAGSQVADLKARLVQTRWPATIPGSGWDYGSDAAYLQTLCHYWAHDFSWPEQESVLNQFAHFKTTWAANNLHFIHQKGKGVTNRPLLLIHGWPDSFYRFIKLIALLTAPDANGVAFDVIVPSIPGFGFSDIPTERGMGPARIATLFHQLMTATLGYDQYYVHGGDWGASIATHMAIQEKEKIKGLHLTNVPPDFFVTADVSTFSETEKACLQTMGRWQRTEGAYVAIQSSKPQTLAFGLDDAPAGLAAWIIEKFNSWSDNKGDIESCFSKEELLTNLSIYWFTRTAGSAARIYYETVRQPAISSPVQVEAPTYFAIFPADCIQIPEAFGQRMYNLKRWKKMEKGGHFAALETPGLLAHDIRAAFTQY